MEIVRRENVHESLIFKKRQFHMFYPPVPGVNRVENCKFTNFVKIILNYKMVFTKFVQEL